MISLGFFLSVIVEEDYINSLKFIILELLFNRL